MFSAFAETDDKLSAFEAIVIILVPITVLALGIVLLAKSRKADEKKANQLRWTAFGLAIAAIILMFVLA